MDDDTNQSCWKQASYHEDDINACFDDDFSYAVAYSIDTVKITRLPTVRYHADAPALSFHSGLNTYIYPLPDLINFPSPPTDSIWAMACSSED